ANLRPHVYEVAESGDDASDRVGFARSYVEHFAVPGCSLCYEDHRSSDVLYVAEVALLRAIPDHVEVLRVPKDARKKVVDHLFLLSGSVHGEEAHRRRHDPIELTVNHDVALAGKFAHTVRRNGYGGI